MIAVSVVLDTVCLQYLTQTHSAALPVGEGDPRPPHRAPLPLLLVPRWRLAQVITVGDDDLEMVSF